MKIIAGALAAAALFCGVAVAALDLSEVGVGARPLGLGRAYVALADDASALFTNPAGLGRNSALNLISMSGAMLGDVNYVLLGIADQSPLGKFGIGYVNASIGGIPLTTLTGTGSTAAISQFAVTDYNSSQVFLSYGTRLSRILKNGIGSSLSFGGSLKYFLQGFSGGGTPLNDASGIGMDADFGLMWEPSRFVSLGLNFQNLLPTSFGGKFTWKRNNVIEAIPMVVHAGGKFDLLGRGSLFNSEDQRADLLVDYENFYGQNKPAAWHLGIEYWPMEMLALRGGLDQKPKATEAGIGVDNNLTAGVGIILGGFNFDYAFHQFGELSENTTHFFSVGFRGEEKYRERAKKKTDKKKPTIPLPEVIPKPEMRLFSDVPLNYWARKPIEYLTTLGIMDGTSEDMFRPTKEISRGELAVLLVKAKGFNVGKEVNVNFRDVPLQSFEAPYISMAVERQYISGYPDGTFQPKKRVTRAEAAVVLARFSGVYVKNNLKSKPFPDLAADHWAAPAVSAAKGIGLFAYLSGRAFGPDLYLTRAEAAEIISKTPFAKKRIEKLISGEKE